MASSVVANTPAGRLRDVFNHIREAGGPYSVSGWWDVVAGYVSNGSDGITVRAEAASLLRDVELAVAALPPEDDPTLLLEKRRLWATPIFGISMNDKGDQQYPSAKFVPTEVSASLANLHSILRREAPEYRAKNDAELIERALGDVHDQLTALRQEVLDLGEELPDMLRFRLLRGIGHALDDVQFVRLRGYGRVYQDTISLYYTAEAATREPEAVANPPLLTRVNKILDEVKTAIVTIEQVFVPGAAAVAVGVVTGDPVGAFAALVATRRALGPVAADSETLALPTGPGDQQG